MGAILAIPLSGGYNRGVKEAKSVRFNMWLKPSVKARLRAMAEALQESEADIVEAALNRMYKTADVREALANATKTEEGS
jgi:hypothetical protein